MTPADPDGVATSSRSAGPVARGDVGHRLIAVERFARGLLLLVVGGVLATHTHTNWAGRLRGWANDLGLDPSRHVVVARLINRAAALTPHQLLVIGCGAVAYGALEIVEGAGLWCGYRWAEYLTVISTALVAPLTVWELAQHPSLLKAGGLVVDVVIVAYLIVMIRRRGRRAPAPHAP